MSSPYDRVTRLKIAYVLYLDIVGFSLLKVDRQLSLVNELNALVRGTQEFQRADTYGDLISLPTGDGMALVFLNEPEAPALCALEIAEGLRAQSQIRLRMGIHYGPIRLHEDISRNKNVVGEGINLAQRVMDCGDAGHILLSSAVAGVLSQSSEWEPCIIYLGECEIKHGLRLQVLNLVRDDLGNPALPAKLASLSASQENVASPKTETASPVREKPPPILSVETLLQMGLQAVQAKALEPPETKDGAEKVYIPAGVFWMGDEDRSDNPRREVSLDAYWIYKTPVTVKQYMVFCKATGHAEPSRPNWGWKDDHPIVNVSWHDAKAYCDWAGAELPTEAQWEKAARGTDGRPYPWGNEWDGSKCANSVGSDSLKGTVAVGSYLQGASPYGVLDMAGNVWEWCWDWYKEDYYQTAPKQNPRGPEKETGCRVLRGGSWYFTTQRFFRCAYRGRNLPANGVDNNGFRCAVRADT